eukprot:4576226-Amphidinium_carterae.1
MRPRSATHATVRKKQQRSSIGGGQTQTLLAQLLQHKGGDTKPGGRTSTFSDGTRQSGQAASTPNLQARPDSAPQHSDDLPPTPMGCRLQAPGSPTRQKVSSPA